MEAPKPAKYNDKYRRESVDGGTTWGAGYQFVGTDGKNGVNGSDANVPKYVQLKGLDFTDITESYVKSPKIEGGIINGAEIFGGRFGDLTNDDNPNAWLEMGMIGGGYGMKLWNKLYQTAPVFTVWDNGSGYTRVSLKNREVLFQDPGYVNKPQGVWDFGEAAKVKGVPVRFG